MARLNFVKKARKANKAAGIKKGDSYYWWKFRTGGRGGIKRISKTRPRRSALTQSEFYGTMYDAEDDLAAALADFITEKISFNDLAASCEQAAEEVRRAGEECQEKYDNMPDGLQQGDTGQMLETRVRQCDEIADQLDNAATNVRDVEPEESAEADESRQTAADEVEGISWDYE